MKTAGIARIAAGAAALAGWLAAAPPGRVNVLLVTIDTLRPDRLSCYTDAFVRTPAIDAVAAAGAVFERAYAHNPTTLPSHANILTGMTPPHHGVSENSKARLPDASVTMAEHLRARGYATGAFVGAFPLDSRFGLDQGFEAYDDAMPAKPARPGIFAERRASEVVDAAAGWISRQSGAWFCWVHLWDPHAPYAPPEPFATAYRDDPYSGEAAYVDAEVGRLLARLREAGCADETLVVLTADHGESLGEHGEMTHSYFAYNSTLHIPLIIAGPGVPARRVGGNASHVDIFPTVCELAGAPVPKSSQGRSLVPAMKGAEFPERPIYFESLEPYLNKGCAPLRGFVRGDVKYMSSPLPEVYDLAADFGETVNLAGTRAVEPLEMTLAGLLESLSGRAAAPPAGAADRATLDRLRSLGYVASPVARLKSAYGPADDLKSFLPYQQRLERAILLSDRGDAAGAIREMTLLTEEKPDFPPAYIYLAQVFQSQGRAADAIRTFEAGLEANPGDYAVLSSFGTILVQTGRRERAREILERAVAVVDFDPEAWDNLGIVFLRLEDHPRALEHFERALALDPTFALAHSNVGAVRLAMYGSRGRSEDLDLALAAFGRAVALNPSLALAHRGLGAARQADGDAAGAIAAWERAVALDPADDFSTYNLGLLHFDRGDKAVALKYFERSLALKGDRAAPAQKSRLSALIEACRR